LLDKAAQGDEPLGTCPETNRPVFLKEGRFGPYVQLGAIEEGEKPKNASLLKGIEPADVTLDVALQLLSLPKTLGNHPQSGEPVISSNGRYGPYIKCGEETRSLPAEKSPIDVTLDEALALLAQPKPQRGRGAPKEPLKTFEASPVTNEPIRLLEGRYGPYVTDGTTNASLPKGTSIEDTTFQIAVNLLAERAAKGPAKKKKAAKKKTAATKKTAAKKKTVAKKKTATKKKSAAKKKPTNEEDNG
jgi:DNA topoisomerase-1